MSKLRTYSELIQRSSFEDRLLYLKLDGVVGSDTFGFDRYLNQMFYRSKEWKDIRNYIIVRDGGCDLGIEGLDIYSRILIHHMNPIDMNDIRHSTKLLMDPEYLICCSHKTHNHIHYGITDVREVYTSIVQRMPNDTCPWKR